MKTLILMRHAEAGTDRELVDDHDKPLTAHGKKEAAETANWLKSRNAIPECILVSTAKRTCQTLDLMLPVLGEDIPALHKKKLYLASVGEILQQIHSTDDIIDSILILAHNPGIQHAAMMLAGKGDGRAIKSLHLFYPPATATILTIEKENWNAFEPGMATLEALYSPDPS